MPKPKRPKLRSDASVERRPPDRIGRLKSMARKLLAELEIIEESNAAKDAVSIDFYEEVKRFETELIVQALTYSAGHQLQAARLLNINPSTLNAKIKQYKIETNTFSRKEDAETRPPPTPKLRVLK
ncbi:MAG TPA: helix-turn-helix domain-containing protein [Pyrinomonadaceae bacterium]|nr:helix-turn-helix domain-containing protein [Pyrinomonadaceae bacterium]